MSKSGAGGAGSARKGKKAALQNEGPNGEEHRTYEMEEIPI